MEKMKSSNNLTLSTNKNNFGNINGNSKFSAEKYNPMTSKNLLNQISFQSLVNKKSGTPKNVGNNNFSNHLIFTSNILESGRVNKNKPIKNDDLFKKQNLRNFNANNQKDVSATYRSINTNTKSFNNMLNLNLKNNNSNLNANSENHMGVFYSISPKNSSFTKNDIKQQIYNNFYNIFSPQIKNNINISDVEKVKDIDMVSLKIDENNNLKINNIMNSNNNVEYKKSFSAFKENKSYSNTIATDNEDNLKKKNKKLTENLILENKKLTEKLNIIKLENEKLKEENEKLMNAKGKVNPDTNNEDENNNALATSSALFSDFKSNRNSNVDKFAINNRDTIKNSSEIMRALCADRNHSKSKRSIENINYFESISNNEANLKKNNEDSPISDPALSNRLSNLKSRTIDMLERLTKSLGMK